jgi:hypothetical protein
LDTVIKNSGEKRSKVRRIRCMGGGKAHDTARGNDISETSSEFKKP